MRRRPFSSSFESSSDGGASCSPHCASCSRPWSATSQWGRVRRLARRAESQKWKTTKGKQQIPSVDQTGNSKGTHLESAQERTRGELGRDPGAGEGTRRGACISGGERTPRARGRARETRTQARTRARETKRRTTRTHASTRNKATHNKHAREHAHEHAQHARHTHATTAKRRA